MTVVAGFHNELSTKSNVLMSFRRRPAYAQGTNWQRIRGTCFLNGPLVTTLDRIPVRYQTFPRTVNPPEFAEKLASVFRNHEKEISTTLLKKGLTSDEVLQVIRVDLERLGFECEKSKIPAGKINRPVLFGENGKSEVSYDIDASHPSWHAVMEVEAGRAWKGNAIYRDLIRASVMVGVEYLILAVPNKYQYKSSGRVSISPDYENVRNLADALYGHNRLQLPYHLMLIGY